jgi:hypothetical protein
MMASEHLSALKSSWMIARPPSSVASDTSELLCVNTSRPSEASHIRTTPAIPLHTCPLITPNYCKIHTTEFYLRRCHSHSAGKEIPFKISYTHSCGNEDFYLPGHNTTKFTER